MNYQQLIDKLSEYPQDETAKFYCSQTKVFYGAYCVTESGIILYPIDINRHYTYTYYESIALIKNILNLNDPVKFLIDHQEFQPAQ